MGEAAEQGARTETLFGDVWAANSRNIIVAPFAIPTSWRIDRAFDFGWVRPFSVGWWAESDGTPYRRPNGSLRRTLKGDLFRVAEWYGWAGVPNQGLRKKAVWIAQRIIENDARNFPEVHPGPADNAIFRDIDGDSVASQMSHAGVHWKRSNGDRVEGWHVLRHRLESAGSGADPGLYIFSTCAQFIRTIPILARGAGDPQDSDTNGEDHIADETRYRVMAGRSRK